MSCSCNLCNSPGYSRVSLEDLLALRGDLLAVIESLKKKDISDTLSHYENRLKMVQNSIEHKICLIEE